MKRTTRATPTTASVQPNTAAAAHAATNTQWQLIFGAILVLAVILSVIILITASTAPVEEVTPIETPSLPPVTAEPDPTAPPTPEPTPTIPVTSIALKSAAGPATDITVRAEWGTVTLTAEVYPVEALTTAKVNWSSTNTAVCTVVDGTITPVGHGQCEVVAECGGFEARCIVRVP